MCGLFNILIQQRLNIALTITLFTNSKYTKRVPAKYYSRNFVKNCVTVLEKRREANFCRRPRSNCNRSIECVTARKESLNRKARRTENDDRLPKTNTIFAINYYPISNCLHPACSKKCFGNTLMHSSRKNSMKLFRTNAL